ncbi:golgin subfamily A member 3-like [Mizuhopecten yessoensis]|uniref:golgin subfamily A member 3-like n=1 Tax=Mizuhopecten yessoensis TaxID=6573 RepID=UPI000B45BADF|nr:golgin subfamily A member 3-like [Mizuhopecten yessoensis]
MDLSWSADHKADAGTILKNLQLEVNKNITELTTNLHQLDSVNSALSEGQATFGQILCETCTKAVESKYKELHSEEDQSQSKKKYKTLAPERQRIVNEITKVFIELERSQSTDKGDEQYCTQKEYHAQQMLELENKYKKDLQNNQAEILDLKKQVKKLITERDDNNKKLKTMSSQLTSNEKFERELRKYQTENKRLQTNLETSERRNEQLRKDVERGEDDLRKQRQSFNEERTRRENEDITDGNIKSFHNDMYTANVEAVRPEHEHDVNTRDRTHTTERQTGQTIGLLHRTNNDNVSSGGGLHQDIGGLSGDVDSTLEETLQKLKQIEKGAVIVQKENDDYRREIVQFHTQRKTLEDKTVSLQKTNEEMALVMRDLQRDNEKLIRERDEYNSDLVKMRRGTDRYGRDPNEKYMKDIEKLEREKRTLQEQNDSLRRANAGTSSALRDLQQDNDGLTDELGIKEQKTHEIKKVLEDIQPREGRSLVMRLRRGYRSGVGRAMVDMVFKELKGMLEGRFDSENIKFSIVLNSTQTNEATVDDGPSFVLCLNTYVQVALGSIKDDRDTYILALHQIDQENLSLLTPTGNSLTGSELQRLGGLLDMAFSSDDGLYECELNKTAVDKIVNLLKQY